ncbi:integrase [Salinibacter ruber]|uniref:site-specific integrase n=1 Tax=Salinibacter ruber TaxID=146919 RepID=UPI00216A70DC|nr:site-specific integrase [Salinibacter ruber]MCS3955401.1 integrase [Salinibacter ruber]
MDPKSRPCQRFGSPARTCRKDDHGRVPIRLRISHRGEKRFIALPVKVLLGKWNGEKRRVTGTHPDAGEINAFRSDLERAAFSVISRLERAGYRPLWPSGSRAKSRGEREEGKSAPEDFLAFAREKVKGYKRRGQIGTFRSYRTTCRKFTAFIEETYGWEEVPFGALDAELFREFRTYCYEERGGSTSAAQRELSVLHALVYHAIKEDKLSAYPFEHIVTHSEPSQKELLTPEEVEQIADLEIDEDSPAAEARRWFLFAYYAGGMRFSDVATLQWQYIREGRSGRPRVCYKMKKTADTVGVPLVPEAKEILARYEEGDGEDWVFPISEGIDAGEEEALHRRKCRRNSAANRHLKELAGRAGIEKRVTFHLSRNAATWKLYQNVGDIYKVSKFLGHSNVEQTQDYIDGFVDESRDEDFIAAMS